LVCDIIILETRDYVMNYKAVQSVIQTVIHDESNKGQIVFRLFLTFLFRLYKLLPFRRPFTIKLGSGAKYSIDPDVPNCCGVVYTRVYEYSAMEVVRNNVMERETMIDIGAHTGLYSLQLADIFSNFILFEPATETYEVLRKNFQLNNALSQTLHNLAVGDMPGKGVVERTRLFDGMATIVPVDEEQKQTLVQINTLDVLCCKTKAGFLKIDVEGFELKVLKGAVKFLKANPRILIHIEITENFEEILVFFTQLNFKLFFLDANKRNPVFYPQVSRGDFWAFGPKIKPR
jgi:FkbM family methyltransferase